MQTLRGLFYALIAILLLLAIAAAVAVFLMLQNEPLPLPGALPQDAGVNQLDLMQLGRVAADSTLELELSAAELNQLARQQIVQANPRVDPKIDIAISPAAVHINFSGEWPIDLKRHYLNIRSSYSVGDSPEQISLDNLQIGALHIPDWLHALLVPYALEYCRSHTECGAALAAYKNVTQLQLGEGTLRLQYALEPGGLDTPSQQDISDEIERLTPYVQELAGLVQEQQGASLSLHIALRRVFALAQRQSVFSANPVAENRSALLALATMGADPRVLDLLNLGALRDQVDQFGNLDLLGRIDLAQHFLTSAALYLLGGSELSEYLGIYKELTDVGNGKPFGVGDLVADRVGIRVAQQATESRASALQLQSQLITSSSEDAYFLSDAAIAELAARYNSAEPVDVPDLNQRIDNLIAKLPLFQS